MAASKSVQTGGHVQDYVASNITDGDASTYWEAEAGFPQTVTVDLGSLQTVGRLQLALPPVSDWNSRTQTIAISGSRTGSSWSRLKGAAGYTFDANSSSQNAVSTSFTQARVRYLRLTFTANSGWSAAQLSELRAHSS
nr:discoidin domain-containing protein [Kineosporia mesophila]